MDEENRKDQVSKLELLVGRGEVGHQAKQAQVP